MFNRIVRSFARAVASAMAGQQRAAPPRFTGQIGDQKLRITVEVDDGVPAVFLMDRATFTRQTEVEDGRVVATQATGIESLIFTGRRLPLDGEVRSIPA